MENEEAFQADAEINGLEHVYSRSSHRVKNEGHDTAKAALGVADPERDVHSEDSPLLSSSREDGGREASEHGAGQTRGPPEWDGEGDFEGCPWWRKPSVRILDPC